MAGSWGMASTMAWAIFAGAMWARRAERMATVDVQSPFEESAGRSMPQSSTSNSGRLPAAWAAAIACLTSSSIDSGMRYSFFGLVPRLICGHSYLVSLAERGPAGPRSTK